MRVAIYKLLLRLYPRAFRERYTPELVDAFLRQREEEHYRKRLRGLLFCGISSGIS